MSGATRKSSIRACSGRGSARSVLPLIVCHWCLVGGGVVCLCTAQRSAFSRLLPGVSPRKHASYACVAHHRCQRSDGRSRTAPWRCAGILQSCSDSSPNVLGGLASILHGSKHIHAARWGSRCDRGYGWADACAAQMDVRRAHCHWDCGQRANERN